MAHEELEGPLSQSFIFDFCENVFFPEPLRSSEVSSCSGGGSGCCYDENSYTELCFSSIPSDIVIASLADPTNTTNATRVLSKLLESNPDSDTSDPTSLNFPPTFSIQSYSAPNQQEQLNPSSLQSQIQLPDLANPAHLAGFSTYSPKSISVLPPPSPLPPMQVLPSVFKEDSFCPTQSYLCVDSTSPSSCSLLDHNAMGSVYGGNLNMGMSTVATDDSIMFSSRDWEFQETNGSVHGSESVYSSGEFQKALNENRRQQQVGASGSHSGSTAQQTASSLEEPSLKVGRLSAEERKEKIHRYMKKRNERNFTKKIKYACRKTLADSRPRVRGRFAKNDEIVEAARPSFMHQEDEDEEVGVKEEEQMLDSSEIFAHISGVNSFRFSYPIQPWI